MSTRVAEPDFADELVRVLASANAQAKINPARLARSTLYDPQYHMAVIACAMRLHGKGPTYQILAPWLKLLQFLAARPSLVGRFTDYVGRHKGSGNELWQQMPRGYLGDETHEAVVDLLVASGVLRKSGDSIEAAAGYSMLAQLASRIQAEDLFSGERRILDHLRSFRVTKVLLGA